MEAAAGRLNSHLYQFLETKNNHMNVHIINMKCRDLHKLLAWLH